MDAGRLDKRISIERVEITQDPVYGSSVESWVPAHTLWASVEPISGREYWQAKLAMSESTVRIRIRYVPGIVSTMRVVYLGRTFGIQSVINVAEANREIQLMCLEHSS